MKILMIADKMDIGGAETHILTLTEQLRRDGIEVTVASAGGVYTKNLHALGVRCVYAPLDRRDPVSMLRSRRIIKEEMHKCNIVHAHTRFGANLAANIRGRAEYPPILVTAHLDFPRFPWGKRCFFGDMTLAVSEDIREHLIRTFDVNAAKIRLTKNGLRLEAYTHGATPRPLIIHTSRIDTGRSEAAILLARAALGILGDYPEYRVVIVGDGDDMKRLTEEAMRTNSALGFEGVILTGARADIPSILKHGTIFVGVSRAALEAMASGLATVIAGNQGFGGIIDEKNFSALAYSNFCARGLKAPSEELISASVRKLIESRDLREHLRIFYKSALTLGYSAESMATDARRCYDLLKKEPRVCLMGYFGFSNLGDEITLAAAIDALTRHNIRSISVIANKSAERSMRGIRIYERTSPKEVSAAIDGCDIFVMCGGNLLQNETSERSLIYYNEIMKLAKRRGKAVYMLSSGFGEVRGKLGRALLEEGIKMTSFCGCRTEYDLKLAKLLGKSDAILMPDLCFLLCDNKSDGEYFQAKKYFAYIPSGENSISPEKLSELGRARGLCPVVIILFPSEDGGVCDKFTKSGICCYFPKSYERIKTLLRGCAFCVTERLHGAIFSLLCHTPSYIMTESAKNRALLDEITRHGSGLIFPYSEGAVAEKKEIGARGSDFNEVIKLFKEKVLRGIEKAF